MAAFPSLDRRHARDLTLKDPYDWFDFLNLHAAALQAQGFEIRVDDDFPFRLAPSSGEFDAEFESSGIDWFELALGVEIDGERRDLAPLLAALVSTPDFAPDKITAACRRRAIISICRSPTVVIFRLPPIASCHWCWRCMACGWAACSRMRSGKMKLSRARRRAAAGV